ASLVSLDLQRIGIAVSVDQAESCPNDGRYDARSQRADLILVNGVQSEERDPVPFLDRALASDGSFGSALGRGQWTSAGFRAMLERAQPLRGRARVAAYRTVVDRLMRAAPFAVYGSWVWTEYFSPKTG